MFMLIFKASTSSTIWMLRLQLDNTVSINVHTDPNMRELIPSSSLVLDVGRGYDDQPR